MYKNHESCIVKHQGLQESLQPSLPPIRDVASPKWRVGATGWLRLPGGEPLQKPRESQDICPGTSLWKQRAEAGGAGLTSPVFTALYRW